MTRRALELQDTRVRLYARQQGLCKACKQPISYTDCQLAHRIANTKTNRRVYGEEVVDHWMNKALTHAGNCNDSMNLGMRPVEAGVLAALIRKEIEET